MRFEPPLQSGVLVRRYKRFLVDVETENGVITMHCANTGAMLGCSDPGSRVWYSTSTNPKRKYAHSLEIVEVDSLARVGVNTARPNALVLEALTAGRLDEFGVVEAVRPEAPIPDATGRFDFALVSGGRQTYIEVKSVTLAQGSLGRFPDAVSIRARRHVQALAARAAVGDRAVLFFCSPHTGIERVTTADDIDPDYADAVRQALSDGVEVLAYGCEVNPHQLVITRRLKVCL